MSNKDQQHSYHTLSGVNEYVYITDTPLYCPRQYTDTSHPRVFLAITDIAICPYCSTKYKLDSAKKITKSTDSSCHHA